MAGTLRFGGDSNTSGNGTLDIASGTVIVTNGLLFGNQSSWSGTGTVNLGKDGMLELGQVRFVAGYGTTTFAAGVGAQDGISVANGTTLALNGATLSSFGALTLAAGSTLDIAMPATDVAAFSTRMLSGIYARPILASIRADQKGILADAMRDIRFSNVHATCLELPFFAGRADCPLDGWIFDNCSFSKVSEEKLPDWKHHGSASWDRKEKEGFVMRHTKGFKFNNTEFNVQ